MEIISHKACLPKNELNPTLSVIDANKIVRLIPNKIIIGKKIGKEMR